MMLPGLGCFKHRALGHAVLVRSCDQWLLTNVFVAPFGHSARHLFLQKMPAFNLLKDYCILGSF